MKYHIWLYKLTNKKEGYNRCMRCGLNKVYIDYVNGFLYFYDDSYKMKSLPKCNKQ